MNSIMKNIGVVFGGLSLVGVVIGAIGLTFKATTATFVAVAAAQVPIVVAYLAAAIVFSNLLSLVIGIVYFAVAALGGLILMSDENTRARVLA